MKTADVVILGAGIVGVSIACHLRQRGRGVILIDPSGIGRGASFGNAGLIERSSFMPISCPRQISELARYATNRLPSVRYRPGSCHGSCPGSRAIGGIRNRPGWRRSRNRSGRCWSNHWKSIAC
jgi:glycine/D-amino acid oxidase-like deaminating enzyme